MIKTEEFAANLMEELNAETAFTIPVFGGIAISESVTVTWLIMALLTVFAIILTRDLRVNNISRKQMVLEMLLGWLRNFFMDLVGEHGKRYVPYLVSTILYISFANMIGLIGCKPPTKDLNVTVALALMTIVLVQYAGIRARGVKGWIKSFAEPVAVILQINLLELIIKPLSLCMRLFGNVIGAFVVMEMLKLCIPVILPIPFSFYFDIFDGLIQAYVFTFLTALYIKEAVE